MFDVGFGARAAERPQPAYQLRVPPGLDVERAQPVEHRPEGLPDPFKLAFLQQFHADGRTTLLLPFGEGHPNENDKRVGCMGEWRPRKGHRRTYDVTLRCLFNQDGEGAYQQSRGIMWMTSKDTMEGLFEMVMHAADGSVMFPLGWGENSATRVKVDPLSADELP